MPGIFKVSSGFHGKVEIPDLGAVIAETASWRLVRRGDAEANSKDPEAELYDLRADLKFVNEALFNDPDYEKRIVLVAGRGQASQSYRIDPVEGPGQRTMLSGRSLVMERVRPVRL